jgi:chitinase
MKGGSKRMVCYYTNWSQYRPGDKKFVPENVDATLCTHLIYAFAKMTNYETAAFEWNDENMDWAKGMYERAYQLKQTNPSMKLLLAIGGWNMGSPEFSTMVHDSNLRSKFVRTAVDFLKKNKFDGLGK